MNIAQAKQIPLEDFLRHLGSNPAYQKSGQLWYHSPFRNEETPSFKLNPTRNVWYDFGLGKGGDIIDLIRTKDQIHNVSEALDRIRQLYSSAPTPVRQFVPVAPIDEPAALELVRVQPVRSKALRAYLESRGIPASVVAEHVKEARYIRDGKEYFALAFANEKGGYELRNPGFKGTLGSKAISVREGSNAKIVAVFEGFIDYLTAKAMNLLPDDPTIVVLNSVGLREQASERIRALGATRIELFLDNDPAGKELASSLRLSHPEAEIVDHSLTYATHGDLNEYWVYQASEPGKRAGSGQTRS